jgi:hypothetical protein
MATKRGNPNWKKGYCPNPDGRPKGKSITMVLREQLATTEGNIPLMVALSKKLIEMALAGDFQAIKYIFDRIDGIPTQAIRHIDEDSNNCPQIIEIQFVNQDQKIDSETALGI